MWPDTVRRRSVRHLGRMGPAGLLLIGRGGREGGVRWTPVRARAYRKPLMLMRVVVGLLVSRRRVGALSVLLALRRSADAPDSNRVSYSRLCLRTGIRVYFSTQCSPLRFFTLAAKATRSSFRCICWGTTAVSGGRVLASGPSCCAARRRRRVLWRGVVMLRGFGSGLLIRKPRRAVVRVGFGIV